MEPRYPLDADLCGETLMEAQWEEGFTCSLPGGHDGPHRDEGYNAHNESTDDAGRKYSWAYEWFLQ